ncbi:hypothetical protein [uncultured Cellulomonas sp.]|uniref:hypothetical protein n=1 Tax=uncultured Cellulomonas sp. TaxID=189682 RepID=UPI002623A629|nr:hypothetical protein [uncultured Cellulomonas sp.]
MNHGKHIYLMLGAIAIGAVLYFTGMISSSALLLLWPLGCVAMMIAMMWGMRGMNGHNSASDEPTRAGQDTRTHTHH